MKSFLFIAFTIFASLNTIAQVSQPDSAAIPEKINYLDSLKPNDFFEINFTSDGCFHHLTRKIKIYKTERSFQLTLYPEKGHVSVEGKKIYPPKKKIKHIILTPDQIEELRIFQLDVLIYNCTNCACTTEDKYQFTFNQLTKTYIDSGCHWKSISKLVKALIKNS